MPRTRPEFTPRLRRAILALAVSTTVAGLLGTALSPYLLVEHPLALVALNPDGRHLLLAAARADLWQVALVAAPRRTLSIKLWTEPIIQFLSRNVVESTAVCVTGVLIHQLWSRWRAHRRKQAGEPDMPL